MKKLWINEKRIMRKPELKRIYLSLVPTICRIAKASGYAVAVHGSMTRDLDVMAMPWTKEAVLPITLAIRLDKALSCYPKGLKEFRAFGTGNKPHGRECYVIYLGSHGKKIVRGKYRGAAIYIDLSVMPLKQ